jgi:hypothetical protein
VHGWGRTEGRAGLGCGQGRAEGRDGQARGQGKVRQGSGHGRSEDCRPESRAECRSGLMVVRAKAGQG